MRVIRTLLPTEFGLLKDHLLRLDPEDRYLRFTGLCDDATVARHVDGLDRFRAVAIAWIEGGRVRGAAELLRFAPPGAERAELAVTVEKAWQDQGIGTELLRRALTVARNRGMEQIFMICLSENGRMRHLAEKFRGRLIELDREVGATVDLIAPDGLSLFQEAMDVGHAAVGAAFEQWTPRRRRPETA
ncbi:MAG: GNAT family N-acetyltransferase [Rhodospirillales bacterium]